MSLVRSLCEWLGTMPSSIALRESVWAYPIIETMHVLGMCLFLGLILMMDLRLVGVANRRVPFSQVQKRLFPGQMAGLAVSVLSGSVLFYAEPMRFYVNIFWWIKVVLLVLAAVNAMAFHLTTYHSVASWDSEITPPFRARLAGALSLVFWAGIVISGRLIAYNWF